jgi:transposase
VDGEVLPGVSRWRVGSTEEKLGILVQSLAPGSSPRLTCRMQWISSGQLDTSRKQFRSGELTGFMPVLIAPQPPALPVPIVEAALAERVKLRVSYDVEAAISALIQPRYACAPEPRINGRVGINIPLSISLQRQIPHRRRTCRR